MAHKRKGRKVALVAGIALVVLSVAMVWTYRKEIQCWYAFWQDFESLGRNAQGYREYRHRQTGIVMVRVPGGTFSMGSSQEELEELSLSRAKKYKRDEEWRRNWIDHWVQQEIPKHQVTVSSFLIAKYELTQAQWIQVMGSNPSHFHPGSSKPRLEKPKARRHLPAEFLSSDKNLLRLPVETVTWSECRDFCAKTGLDLPTEAQWEYACRAGTTGPYGGTGKLEEMGWQREDCTYPVGLKKPNGYGIHDMHGNVCEWCKDVYNEKFYVQPAARVPDPLCESGSSGRVYRGGGYDHATFHHRSAYRFRGMTFGGRVQQSPPGDVGLRPAYYPLP